MSTTNQSYSYFSGDYKWFTFDSKNNHRVKNKQRRIFVSNNHFLIMQRNVKEGHILCEYNMFDDEYLFDKPIQYPYHYPSGEYSATIDEINEILYICLDIGIIITYHLQSNSWSKLNTSTELRIPIGIGACSVIINGDLHVIGGTKNNKHLKWNNKTKSFIIIYEFSQDNISTKKVSLIYMKRKQMIYLLIPTIRKHIYRYSVATNVWQKIHFHALSFIYSTFLSYNRSFNSYKAQKINCFPTSNEKYIVLFGGSYFYKKNYIQFIDVENLAILKSNIKCPVEDTFDCYLLAQYKTDDLTVCGFIRRCWNSKLFENIRFPSYDAIAVIKLFYCIEDIHLFDSSGNHWKKAFDVIFNNSYVQWSGNYQ
eukprot:106803_1